MNERNCTNCLHFVRAESETAEALEFGECTHSPPVLVVIDDEPTTMFPLVDKGSRCGQWSPSQ